MANYNHHAIRELPRNYSFYNWEFCDISQLTRIIEFSLPSLIHSSHFYVSVCTQGIRMCVVIVSKSKKVCLEYK